jgi:hypothetical protein
VGDWKRCPCSFKFFGFSCGQSTAKSNFIVEKATYLAIAAKFTAESSSEVGKEATTIMIGEKDDMLKFTVPTPRLEKIRLLWEERGAPRIPENIEVEMKSHIMTLLQALAPYQELSR